MVSRREIVAAFDAIAEEFAARRRTPWPETLAFAESLPPRARVLDLGCGAGRNLEVLRGRGRTVVGLDASDALLRLAPAGVGPIVQGDAVRLPFRAATFDAAHCVAAVHHLPTRRDREGCMREIARVLRPGCPVLATAWALEQERFRPSSAELPTGVSGSDVWVPWRRRDGVAVPRFYHVFSEGELESLAGSAGLLVDRAWREGDNHAVLARRP